MSIVPDSFPRDPWPTAIGGTQTKFSARLIEWRFVVGLTEVERRERYEYCADLLQQLVPYCQRKRAEAPHVALDAYLQQLETRVRGQGWDVSPIEITWMMNRVKEQL